MRDDKELDVRRQEARLNQNIDKMFYQACELFQAQIKGHGMHANMVTITPWRFSEEGQRLECDMMAKFLYFLYSACSAEVTSHAD